MNTHSLWRLPPPVLKLSAPPDRVEQILDAAMRCFTLRGFHGCTMQDISGDAGISVGLIYRYFKNKEDVITALAARHQECLREVFERAEQAPDLFEALEVIFTSPCGQEEPSRPGFVAELFAESARNPLVADLMRDVIGTARDGLKRLIQRSPQASHLALNPQAMADVIFAVHHGSLMHAVLSPSEKKDGGTGEQMKILRELWRVLFQESAPAAASRCLP